MENNWVTFCESGRQDWQSALFPTCSIQISFSGDLNYDGFGQFLIAGFVMKHPRNILLALLSVLLLIGMVPTGVQAAEKRIALVVGNANYQVGALPTPANDAGLIAQTLQAAGFDVTGARDLDQDSLRHTFRDFIDKVSASGPDTVALIYLSGYGLQLEGENYFAPTDAKIARDANVSSEALRVSDYTKPLAALGIKASIVVLDVARPNPFAKSGPPLAGGLALVEPEPGTLIAFNAAPGTVAPDEAGPYSSYAQALAEMMREGGVPVTDLFNRIRLRVNETTKGALVPWDASKLTAPFYFFERAPDAPPPQISAEQTSSIRSKPIRDFDARDAYLAALDRDNLQDYENFLIAYPRDPMAKRVRAIVAARREAITWRRSRSVDSPRAYWSYLRRYPRGSHAHDARRRLDYLAAAFEPPPRFEIISYDVPPPPPEEVIYVERPILMFDDPDFGFEPPPPPPVFFLPPRPAYFVDLAPPPPAIYAYVLPVPTYAPVPVWVNTPEYVAPPPNNVIYNNIHNTVVVNNTTNTVVITNPSGQSQTFSPQSPPPASQTQPAAAAKSSPSNAAIVGAGIAGAGAAALLAPSLPRSVAPKAIPIQNTVSPNPQPPGQTPAATSPGNGKSPAAGQPPPMPSQSTQPVTPGQAPKPASPETKGPQTLPGSGGQPLPSVNGKPPIAGQPLPSSSKPVPAATPGPSPKTTLPETKEAQPLPGGGGQPLPPINGKPPLAGQSLPAPTKPVPAATPGPGPKTTLPETKGGQPSSRSGGPLFTPEKTKPPIAGQPPSPQTQPKPPAIAKPASAPPPVAKPTPTPPPAAKLAPPPPVARPTPPPPAAPRPAPPPPAARPTLPAPPAARPAPPPPPVMRPAPPPPPAARPAPPTPPAARPAPPPPAARPASPPPPAARPAPAHPAPSPAKPCVLPNGQPCPQH